MLQSVEAEDGQKVTWEALDAATDKVIYHGAVFRLLKAVWPHETPVDLLVVEDRDSPSGFALVVATGYKAGLTFIKLPAQAVASGVQGLDRSWVVANWSQWVYPECPTEAVLLTRHYCPGIG